MEEIINPENVVFKKTKLLNDKPMTFCPGCGHGVAHRLVGEVIEEMGIQSKTIGIAPVGCSVFAYEHFELDMHQAAHGRAAAVATAINRVRPDLFVFAYQGDGDLAAIGTAETIHAANRGENFLTIFINNAIYGMTGGQMAPTTLEKMKTTTTPFGRNVSEMGYPVKMTEIVAQLPGTCYVTRQSVHKPANVRKAKKTIRKGFENQKLKKGLSFIEIVSACPTNWRMSPVKANQWLEDEMIKFFPLGDLKDE